MRSNDYDRDSNWNNDNNRYRNEGWNDRYNNYREQDRNWWDKTKDEVASWFGDDDAQRRRNRDERYDERHNGEHRGKGPKNYTRSQERIKEDVSDKLSDDSFLDASDIDVEVNGNEVTLNGHVDSRYSKHRAEDLAEDVTGVSHVQNNLRVWDNTRTSNSMNTQNTNTNMNTSSNSNTTTGSKNKKEHVTM
jgi:osmotically-inducible protein OsmY